MAGEEVYFEFGLPELAMLALMLVCIYSIAEAIAWVSRKQKARLARVRAAEQAAREASEESEPESA
jgi:hypothetical protein